MLYLQAIFLGIVQGITEFLPISSSGHLVIFQKIFGFSKPPIAIDVLVHLGTVFSLLIFLRKNIKDFLKGFFLELRKKKRGKNVNLLVFLIIGTIPIVLLGLLLKEKIDIIFNSLSLLGISFLVTSIILFLTQKTKEKKNKFLDSKKDAFFIGIFQALAILPGVSRSGSTISAGLYRGIKKEEAFNFSFFLGIIAILGATIIQIPEINNFNNSEILNGILGFLFAAFFGFIALRILKPIVLKGKFHYFGVYCMVLGFICIILSLI
jgi:undecaprenyl-diphosphatase